MKREVSVQLEELIVKMILLPKKKSTDLMQSLPNKHDIFSQN